MIKLKDRAKQQNGNKGPRQQRVSIRDHLLRKEIPELGRVFSDTCKLEFEDADKLSEFVVTVTPNEGYWYGGTFKFQVIVPEDYNNSPPEVKCLTKVWHPNVTETGDICLSVLRPHSVDGYGWAPTRTLNDVVVGLVDLFTLLVNFDDPLNDEAADQHKNDQAAFIRKVKDYVQLYAKR